jgi:3-deoxy-D-manno-octulosonate 8-phosphate phosphatase (KDO 8-P phosphatase)
VKNPGLHNRLKRIRFVVMDVDGVLTDGRVTYDDRGNEYKSFDVHDGFGIRRGIDLGLRFAIITGRKSPIVSRRGKELGVADVLQGQREKLPALLRLMKRYHCPAGEVCVVGDDENDLSILQAAGISAAPSNATAAILKSVDIVTRRAGGRGAVRELIDMILQAQGLIE